MMRDPKTESWLERFGWEFEYHPEIPIDQIRLDKLAKDQIRFDGKFSPEQVTRIAEAIEDGAKLPAVLIALDTTGEYAILDGINRTSGVKKSGQKTIDAYLITNIEPAQYELIRRSINTIGGRGLDLNDSIQQALYLMNYQGLTQIEAARRCNVSPGLLSAHVKTQAYREKIAQLSPKMPVDRLPQEAVRVLGRIPRPDLCKAAVEISILHKFTTQTVRDVFLGATECYADAEALLLLEKWAHDYPLDRKKPAPLRPSRSPEAVMDRACGRLRGAFTQMEKIKIENQNEIVLRQAYETLKFTATKNRELLERTERALQSRVGSIGNPRWRGASRRDHGVGETSYQTRESDPSLQLPESE